MRLPVGIQSFEEIRSGDFLYVDKTEYIYRLAHYCIPYFLSRPRGFGKSLLISAMKAYWEGRKELFRGLKIEELECGNAEAWQGYPVFCFEFGGKNYRDRDALENLLQDLLAEWGKAYEIDTDLSVERQFRLVLRKTHKETGKNCVVLVDEYDKPLLDAPEDKELVEHNKELLKQFFGILNGEEDYLQFVFITGETKFAKGSIFGDLKQLRDISSAKEYAGICGISRKELEESFAPEIEALSEAQECTVAECLERLRCRYDGYRFHEQGGGIFHTCSILRAFAEQEFGAYWSRTEIMPFLIKRLREKSFDVQRFAEGTIHVSKRMLSDYRDDPPDPIVLLYQTGYLTLEEYIRDLEVYILTFPNEEVKEVFVESLQCIDFGSEDGPADDSEAE